MLEVFYLSKLSLARLPINDHYYCLLGYHKLRYLIFCHKILSLKVPFHNLTEILRYNFLV